MIFCFCPLGPVDVPDWALSFVSSGSSSSTSCSTGSSARSISTSSSSSSLEGSSSSSSASPSPASTHLGMADQVPDTTTSAYLQELKRRDGVQNEYVLFLSASASYTRAGDAALVQPVKTSTLKEVLYHGQRQCGHISLPSFSPTSCATCYRNQHCLALWSCPPSCFAALPHGQLLSAATTLPLCVEARDSLLMHRMRLR